MDDCENRPHKLSPSNARFRASSASSSTSDSASCHTPSSASSSISDSTSSHISARSSISDSTSSHTSISTSSSDEAERTHKTKNMYTRDFWTLDLKQCLDKLIFFAECHLLLDRTLHKDDIMRPRSRDKLVVGTVIKCKHKRMFRGRSRIIKGKITARGPSNTYTVTFKQPNRSKEQELGYRRKTEQLRRHFEAKLRAVQESINNSDTKGRDSDSSDESSADVRSDKRFRVEAHRIIFRAKQFVRALELSLGSTSLQAICHQRYVRRCVVAIWCLGRQVVGGVVQNICFMSGVRRRIAQYAAPSRMENMRLAMNLPDADPRPNPTAEEELGLQADKRSKRDLVAQQTLVWTYTHAHMHTHARAHA